MRFNRILLISPPSSSYLGAVRPPQNLGYLAQALDDHGIEQASLDMRLGRSFRRLERTIRKFNPDLIEISLVSHEYQRAYDLIRNIKRRFESIPIIAGGPHATVLKERVLRECPEIDFGAGRRIYARNPLLRWSAVLMFASGMGEKLFFGSNRFRQVIENIRFNRMLRTRNAFGETA